MSQELRYHYISLSISLFVSFTEQKRENVVRTMSGNNCLNVVLTYAF